VAFSHDNIKVLLAANLGNVDLNRFNMNRDSSEKSLQISDVLFYSGDIILVNGEDDDGEAAYCLVLCRKDIIRTTSFGMLKTGESPHAGKGGSQSPSTIRTRMTLVTIGV
jgi:hypothetical protein